MTFAEQVGRRIAKARNERHWTQRHLADMAGVNQNTVMRIEAGRNVHYFTLIDVTKCLGLPIDSLFGKADCQHEFCCRFCGEKANG